MEKKLQNKMLLLIISFSLIAAMIAASGIVFASASTPTVWTDKDDYAPGETVVITGTGFPANKKLIVQIIRPQGSDMLPVKTDGSGSFTLEYKLTKKRAMDGTYQVLVIDPLTGDVLAATTFTDAGDESFWGYNLQDNKWTHGNLGKDYYEGDFVSYQLVITKDSKVWGDASFDIKYNFHQDSSNAIYIDGFDISTDKGFQYVFDGTLIPNGQQWPSPAWTHIPTPEAGDPWTSGPRITNFMEPLTTPETPADPSDFRYFTVEGIPWPTSGTENMTLFFRAHLALNIIWSNGIADNLPTSLDGDEFETWGGATHYGSSFATGSSRHFYLESPGIGQKTIPIPIVNYPDELIFGYKYVDGVRYNGWNISIASDLGLEGAPPDVYEDWALTGTGMFLNGTAWPIGYYEFTGLLPADFEICEQAEEGDITYDYGDWVTGPQIFTPPCITIPLERGDKEQVDFYNIEGWPILDILKGCDAKVLVASPIIYTINLTNTGLQDAEGVEVTDVLPAGVSYTGGATATSGSITESPAGTLVWTGDIPKVVGSVNITIPVTATATGAITDTATYTQAPANTVYTHTSASCTTVVFDPSLTLDKEANETKILTGEGVEYEFTLENTGDMALVVDVVDSELGLVLNDYPLAVSEIFTWTNETTLTANTTNTATATGSCQFGDFGDTASDEVFVFDPDISITKTCSPDTQLPLGSITWVIEIENTGDYPLTATAKDDYLGVIYGPDCPLAVGEKVTITITYNDLGPGTYTNTANVTGYSQFGEVFDEASSTCEVEALYLKVFSDAGAIGGFTEPDISCEGLCSTVYELHSGPRIWWNITYYFENSEDFLGDEFDGETHAFRLWDKWGGNLMALNSTPTDFNEATNVVTLANGKTIHINPRDSGPGSYRDYVGEGIELTDCCGGTAWITMHTGDQQQGTNPGQGGGTDDDGKSYDTDVVWEIGELDPGEGRSLTIVIAPGKNPGGILQFSSPGCEYINTGPRVRVYVDDSFTEFEYAIDRTNQLRVCVEPD
jgi:uncharacterized repeat protein (TIGR01451 family)